MGFIKILKRKKKKSINKKGGLFSNLEKRKKGKKKIKIWNNNFIIKAKFIHSNINKTKKIVRNNIETNWKSRNFHNW